MSDQRNTPNDQNDALYAAKLKAAKTDADRDRKLNEALGNKGTLEPVERGNDQNDALYTAKLKAAKAAADRDPKLAEALGKGTLEPVEQGQLPDGYIKQTAKVELDSNANAR